MVGMMVARKDMTTVASSVAATASCSVEQLAAQKAVSTADWWVVKKVVHSVLSLVGRMVETMV